MFRAKRVILVNAPVDQVFDYLTDFDRHGEWDGDSDLEFGGEGACRLLVRKKRDTSHHPSQ